MKSVEFLKKLAGIAALGMGMLVAGCDNGTDSGETVSDPNLLLGKWDITDVHEKGWRRTTEKGKQPVTNAVDGAAVVDSGDFIEFKSDKSFVLDTSNQQFGTWFMKSDTIVTIISYTGLIDTTEYKATISGNRGTFSSHRVSSLEYGGILWEDDIVYTIKATRE